MLQCFDLTGKTAIITGASKGLGEAIAMGLAKSGCDLFLVSRNGKQLEKNTEIIRQLGVRCAYETADVTDQEQVRLAIEKCVEQFETIDILFNNAGTDRYPFPPEEASIEQFERVMRINCTGSYIVAQEVVRHMIRQGYGKIINMGSICGEKMVKDVKLGAYDVSKAALHCLTKVLAVEWSKYNITVNAIAPGFFLTEPNIPYFVPGSSFIEEAPLKRVGNPEELEGIGVFMASSASDFMQGTIVHIDGGVLCV